MGLQYSYVNLYVLPPGPLGVESFWAGHPGNSGKICNKTCNYLFQVVTTKLSKWKSDTPELCINFVCVVIITILRVKQYVTTHVLINCIGIYWLLLPTKQPVDLGPVDRVFTLNRLWSQLHNNKPHSNNPHQTSKQQSINTHPTHRQHPTNTQSTHNQHSVNTRPTFGQHSVNTRPTFGQHLTNTQTTLGQHSANTRPTCGQHTTNSIVHYNTCRSIMARFDTTFTLNTLKMRYLAWFQKIMIKLM